MWSWIKRVGGLSLLALLTAVAGYGQNFTAFSASNIQNLQGTKLASGTLYIQGTDANNTAISFQCGGGGQVVRTPYTATITTGAIVTFNVCNPANTLPQGIYYHVWVIDQTSGSSTYGQTILNYGLVQWNGATFNFDNYTPTGNVSPPSGYQVNGNMGVNGNLTVTGNLGVTGAVASGSYNMTAGSGLILNIAAGAIVCPGVTPVPVSYAGGTLTMTASSTNYVYLNESASCVPASNTSGFTSTTLPLATVVTSGSGITSIVSLLQVAPGALIPGLVGPAGPSVSIGASVGSGVPGLGLTVNLNGNLAQWANRYDASAFSGSDAGAKIVNCLNALPIAGWACDASTMGATLTSASSITTTNTYVALIFGNQTLTFGSGSLLVPWQGIKLYGTSGQGGGGTLIQSTNTDTIATATLIGGADIEGIEAVAPVGHYAVNVPFTQSFIAKNDFVGGSGGYVSASSGCSCTNVYMFNSFYAYNSDGSGIGLTLNGNSNSNEWFYNAFGSGSGGRGLKINSGYNNDFVGFTDEAALPAATSIEITAGGYEEKFRGCDLENDSVEGTGSTLFQVFLDSGTTLNKIDCPYDVVDNSGNKTNVYGTASSYPLQTYNPGSFLASQIPTYSAGPGISPQTAYYASQPAAFLPTGTYFSGGSYTVAGWVYPTLATYPLGPGNYAYQLLFNIASSPTGTDGVIGGFYINGGDLQPYLQVYEGSAYHSITDTCSPTNQAWNYVMYSWDSSTGKATLSCNGTSGSGAQTIWAPNNVTRTSNTLGGAYKSNIGYFDGRMAMWTIYNTALSTANASSLYTAGTSGSGYQATITGGTYGGVPVYFWPMNDAPTIVNVTSASPTSTTNTYASSAIPGVTTFNLTSVDTGTGTYHGTITGGASNAFAGLYCSIAGFTNTANNFSYYTIASTASTLVLSNPGTVAETHAATATCSLLNLSVLVAGFSNSGNNGFFTPTVSTSTSTTVASATGVTESASGTMSYAASMAEPISGNSGGYAGPVKVGVATGIPGDTTGSGKAALFGGDTLYTFYETCNDWNGDNNGASPPSYGVAFSPLTLSYYLQVGIQSGYSGCKNYSVFYGDTSHYLTKGGLSTCGMLQQQMPINVDGSWTSTNSPACPLAATNITGRIGTTMAAVTVTGTTAGNLYWSNPINGTAYKKVLLNFQGYENTTGTGQTITLPTAFSYTPATTGSCPSNSFAVSTTMVTLPYSMGATFTGQCFAEGQ